MKRLFSLIAFTAFLSATVYTQETVPDSVDVYCLISGNQIFGKVRVSIDFGGYNSAQKENESADMDPATENMKFSTMVQALNYLSLQGWTYLDAYSIAQENQISHHWLMKKKVPVSHLQKK
jgi:hypothetical protein